MRRESELFDQLAHESYRAMFLEPQRLAAEIHKPLLTLGIDACVLAALDRETLAEFHKSGNKRQRTLADRIVEEAAGRTLTVEERDAALEGLGAGLRQQALQRRS